ncbi:23S rRNA (adenine(2030)-N(6))-methyltransferase RlmJ [Bacillus sp. NP157]|nr:23S rRNA (adenine(2030)-N(6))-methyltransferase RlmJ [Bacillus sp. NP157]
MNYRHAYHAGNFADVMKHMVLVALIDSMKQKPTPFCYIETHAGSGRYDLRSREARKTGEADDGVSALKTATGLPPLAWKWLEAVRACNEGDDTFRFYPGSPWFAAHQMRENDSAQLCELQAQEAGELRQLFHNDKRVHVHHRDGYEALGALVPPKEKRGLVLIDPPFEQQDNEFRVIEKALKAAMEKWPTGIFAVWYPIKLRSHVQPFHRWLSVKSGAKRVLAAELLLHKDDSPLRLNGSGMVIVNAPWKLDDALRDGLKALPKLLGEPGEAEYRLTWLVEEGKDPAALHIAHPPRSLPRR